MIGRKTQNQADAAEAAPQSFDDFALRLGDVMRGERATLGKSLLDVQRELRIKASYIAAIENCDPSAFDTPGFIAGYVRSYARYLGMDPDEAFAAFCAESGFSVAHGMSQEASTIRKPADEGPAVPRARNPLAEPNTPFAPASESWMSRIEPAAIGSSLVLIALISGIGYGGWAVLQEIQRVQITPVDQTPVVLSELDPLAGAIAPSAVPQPAETNVASGVFTPPSAEAYDRLLRPQALDVPIVIARDGPISTLDPESSGVFAGGLPPGLPSIQQDSDLSGLALAQSLANRGAVAPAAAPVTGGGVTVLAVRPAWVQVADEDGRVLFSRVMDAGETFAVPRDATAPVMNVGESGSVYVSIDGSIHGPVGARGEVTENLSLVSSDVEIAMDPALPGEDDDLMTALIELDLQRGSSSNTVVAQATPQAAPQPVAVPQVTPRARTQVAAAQPIAPPRVLAEQPPMITVVATEDTWVEVTAPSGKKLFAQVLEGGKTYQVPQTDQAPTIFSGNAGGVFFEVNGQTFGPYGESGQFGRDLALSAQDITQKMQVADLTQNRVLARVVAELRLQAGDGANR